MTEKEKAKELVDKMDMVVGGGNYDAKEYALIAVKEILNVLFQNHKIDYWKEVKEEILKM
jgi:hypothetical protein